LGQFCKLLYVKDLKAGKLDSQAQIGRFVGYNSESKGYWIYWPAKRSITVERNVVFNGNDVHTTLNTVMIQDDALAEEERDKVIQSTGKPINQKDENVGNQSLKSIPSMSEPVAEPHVETPQADELDNYGRGKPPWKPTGAYKDMNEGLTAAIAHNKTLTDLEESLPQLTDNDESFGPLPPDFACIGSFNSEPQLLDDALHGPNANEWQEALDYEIGQLKKLGTWVIEDLPAGHTPIPCNEVLKVKQGPNGEVLSYRVC